MPKSPKRQFDLAAALKEMPAEARERLLRSAVVNDNVEALKSILAATTFSTKVVSDALHLAATHDHQVAVPELLKLPYINVNFIGDDGYTPLMRAASNGHREIFEMLMAREDININALTSSGNSNAAILATYAHERDIVRKLMDDPRFDGVGHQALVDRNEAERSRSHREITRDSRARGVVESKIARVRKALGLPEPEPLGG